MTNAEVSKESALEAQRVANANYTSAYGNLSSSLQTTYTDFVSGNSNIKNTLANLSEENFEKFKALASTSDEDIDGSDLTADQKNAENFISWR